MNLGRYGEKKALAFLNSKGFELIKKNYRFLRAEVDIILKNDSIKTIVFVEVKTRKPNEFAEAEDSVGSQKYNQIMKAAEGFVMQNPKYEDYEKRFDIISVYINGKTTEIKHFEDVF